MTITENESTRTPLHIAIYSRRFCHVRKLIQLGSPVNTIDARAESPLITALKMNNVDLAKFLLQAGASYQTGNLILALNCEFELINCVIWIEKKLFKNRIFKIYSGMLELMANF